MIIIVLKIIIKITRQQDHEYHNHEEVVYNNYI
jgi:hypothetical protein